MPVQGLRRASKQPDHVAVPYFVSGGQAKANASHNTFVKVILIACGRLSSEPGTGVPTLPFGSRGDSSSPSPPMRSTTS